MTKYIDLIAQAALKQTDLGQTAATKQSTLASTIDPYQVAANRGTDQGMASANQVEQDLRTLDPVQLSQKYGPQTANDLLGSYARGLNQVNADRTAAPGVFDALATGVGAFGSTVAGIATLPALAIDIAGEASGLGNPNLTGPMSEAIQTGREAFDEFFLSDGAKSVDRLLQAELSARRRDNDAQFDRAIADGTSPLEAGAMRIGRGITDVIGEYVQSPARMALGTSEAVGSLFVTKPVKDGLESAGRAVLDAATKSGVKGTTTEKLAKIGKAVSVPAAIGLMEGGGGVQQTAAEVQGKTHEQLMKTSPTYPGLVQRALDAGLSQSEAESAARAEITTDAALTAGAISGTAGAALGRLVSRFEGENLLARPAPGQLAGNAAREAVEEGGQGAVGSAAQNLAIQQQVDRDRQISSGVGEAAGQGALFGFGAVGTVQGVPSAVGATVDSLGSATKGLRESISKVGNTAKQGMNALAGAPAVGALTEKMKSKISELDEKLQRQNEASSPISDEAIGSAATQLQEASQDAAVALQDAVSMTNSTEEEKASANALVERMTQSLNLSQEEIQQNVHPSLHSVMAQAKNRVQAIQMLSGLLINDGENALPDNARAILAQSFLRLIGPIQAIRESDEAAISRLDPNSAARKLYDSYAYLVANIENSPSAIRALTTASEVLTKAVQDAVIQDSEVGTQTAQEKADTIIGAATVAPDQGNLEATRTLLRHAQSGAVALTAAQNQVLRASLALMEARERAQERAARGGFTNKVDIVSDEVMSRRTGAEYAKSLTAHVRDILAAMNAGNRNLAAARLTDLGKFAQHMNNKVGAINAHLAAGNPNGPAVHYAALRADATRGWKTSEKGEKVYPTKPGSVEYAQTVALEAEAISNVFNQLVDTYPQLGSVHVEITPLDALLDGLVEDVVADFTNGTRFVTQNNNTAETVEEATPIEEPTVVSQITPEQAQKLTDAGLQHRLDLLTDKQMLKENTAEDDATFAVLDAEMTAREEALAEEQIARARTPVPVTEQRQEEAPPAAETTATEPVAEVEEVVEEAEPVEEVTEPVADEVVEEAETDSAVEAGEVLEETPPAIVAKGLDSLYPNLFGGNQNTFKAAYKISKKAIARFIGFGSGLMQEAINTLTDVDTYANVLGAALKVPVSESSARGYANLLAEAPVIKESMNRRLRAAWDKKDRKFVEKGGNPARTAQGRVYGIAELDGTSVKYNDELIDSAIFAAMQILMDGNRIPKRHQDFLEGVLQEPLGALPVEAAHDLMSGVARDTFVNELARKITEYWGITKNSDVGVGITDGIPASLALELVESLKEVSLVQQISYTSPISKKTVSVIRVASENIPETAKSSSKLIERLFVMVPELDLYFGDDKVPRRNTYMGTDRKITARQQRAQKYAQETEHFWDETVLKFYEDIGQTGREMLMDGYVDPSKAYNQNHLIGLQGRNLLVTNAYAQMQAMRAEAAARAEEQNVPVADLGMKFAYGFAVQGRMHMLSAYNPQTNKLMREAILPTWSTLDLSGSNDQHLQNFYLALAQAMGISIHVIGVEASVAQIRSKLEGTKLADAVRLAQDWNQQTESSPEVAISALKAIQEGLRAEGLKFNPAAAHAFVEYARFLNAAEKSAFRTSLYVEADGVTNGVINLISLFSYGQFTEQELANLRMGGVSYSGKAKSLKDLRQESSVDFYGAVGVRMANGFNNFLSVHKRSMADDFSGIHAAMGRIAALFMDGVSTATTEDTDNGDDSVWLQFGRNAAKGPTTQASYGAQADSVGKTIAKDILSNFYAKMSEVAAAKKANPSVNAWDVIFPNHPNAKEQYRQLIKDMGTLSKAVIYTKDKKLKTFQNRSVTPFLHTGDFTQISLSPEGLENFNNMVVFFLGGTALSAVHDQLGRRLTGVMSDIAAITDFQSTLYALAYKRAVDQKIQDKLNDDAESRGSVAPEEGSDSDVFVLHDFRKSDLLSRDELQEIEESLLPLVSNFTASGMNFVIHKQQRAPFAEDAARDLSSNIKTSLSFNSPAASGVQAIPLTNLGAGDANTMLHAISDLGSGAPVLEIFDGLHIPLDQIQNMGSVVNAAAGKAWRENPAKGILESFQKTLKFVKDTEMDQEGWVEDLYLAFSEVTGHTPDKMLSRLTDVVASIDKRREATAKSNRSIDQFAGSETPSFQGILDPEGSNLTLEEQAALLSQEMGLVVDTPAPSPAVKQASVPANSRTKKGARVLSKTALRNMLRHKDITDAQKQILRQVLKVLNNDEWSVIVGSRSEIADYQKEHGLLGEETVAGMEGTTRGYTDVGAKRVYLYDLSMETLVHELVHASTFEAVLRYFRGEELSAHARAAADRLVAMMHDFLDQGLEGSVETELAYLNAREAVNSELRKGTPEGNAKALNEFMAWALTNQKITDALSQVEAPFYVRLARKVVREIKNLFWGNQRVEKPAEDFLSNLQFNTGILIREQATLAKGLELTSLLPMNEVFGADERIHTLTRRLDSLVQKIDAKNLLDGRNKQGLVRTTTPIAVQMTMDAAEVGFNNTTQQNAAFTLLATTLLLESGFNTEFTTAAQRLYTHVLNNISADSFLKTDDPTNVADTTQAQQKMALLSGKRGVSYDAEGNGSTLLAMFMGLAATNDEFREILSKIELPKALRSDSTSRVDQYLENLGNSAVLGLENRLAYRGENPSDIADAVNTLLNAALNSAEHSQNMVEDGAKVIGGAIDRANDYVVEKIQRLADSAVEVGERLKGSDYRVVRYAGTVTQLTSQLLSSASLDSISKGIVEQANELGLGDAMTNFITDVTGRNSGNASVYDLIKLVKTETQQTRQIYRTNIPEIISSKFSRELTSAEWSAMTSGMAKSDLAALRGFADLNEIRRMLENENDLSARIAGIESELIKDQPNGSNAFIHESKRLVRYMLTGVAQGSFRLRNATAIANLLGKTKPTGWTAATPERVANIDRLVTLYYLSGMESAQKADLLNLMRTEQAGMEFVYSYLLGLRADEQAKLTTNVAKYNHHKGYVLPLRQDGVELIVADTKRHAELIGKSYVRVADYTGSSLGYKTSMGYYKSRVGGRADFNQGIFQNIRATASGVDPRTGFSLGLSAGRITEPAMVQQITARLTQERATPEPLEPIFDENGEIRAYEMTVNHALVDQHMAPEQNLSRLMGAWRGRQVEEYKAAIFNRVTLNNLYDMYDKDSHKDQYVNLFEITEDPVYAYAASLLSKESRDYAESLFGDGKLMVRRDMLKDVLGYPAASIGDAWTGISRWSKPVQDGVRTILTNTFGNDAYKRMVQFESFTQGLVSDLKILIAVKSGIIPMLNLAANVLQLVVRGVPIASIVKGSKRKTVELNAYVARRNRQVEAEAELLAATTDAARARLEAELQSISDANHRMTIWPLVQAGEFSAISDIGLTHNEYELTDGRLGSYVDGLVEKLPQGLKTAGRYALITKDTALYQGLQKSVQYGDFLAKAVMYDHLIQDKKMSKADALGRITEAFVNYDVLPGRFRGSLESLGVLWFYHFKIRIAKEALSIIRDNPVQALLYTAMATAGPVTSPGSPLSDNIFSKLIDGSLGWSIGPEMAFSAPELNPWVGLTN